MSPPLALTGAAAKAGPAGAVAVFEVPLSWGVGHSSCSPMLSSAKPCSKARGPGMPKDRDRKIEEAIVRAESAQQAALNALTMAQVLGSILESTLAMLQAKEVVAPDDLRQIFFGAAAAIDELKPSNENERGAQQAMRATVVHIAKRFRIEIPPPGQTGMPRKH